MPQNKETTIREYQPEDFDRVFSGLLGIDNEERSTSVGLTKPSGFEESLKNWLKDILLSPSCLIIIAEKVQVYCGFIIGIVEFQPQALSDITFKGIIQAVWIEPEYRRSGVATLLVKEMIDAFTEHQVPFCDVCYAPNNINAQAFWHSQGFTPTQVHARKRISE